MLHHAVIFASERTEADGGYGDTVERMVALANETPGFIGGKSVRDAEGLGLSVSYFRDLSAFARFQALSEHGGAQERGRRVWYARYTLRMARVEHASGFVRA
ncbi:MAG: hypothetical protein RL385_4829 [Pseudomonadota bacterium]